MLRNLIAVAALIAVPAYAADNFVVKDATGTTISKKSKEVSGAQADQNVLIDSSGNEVLGTVTASPTANTIGDRLKTINTTLGSPFQAGGSVTVSSSALPTGAATAAKQPALGTAGTPSADVLTMQGRTGMTPVTTQGGAASGAAVSGNPNLVAGFDGTNARSLKTTAAGVLASPSVGTCDGSGTNYCKITHTNLSSDTATVICPATSNVIVTMIYFTTADVGVSLVGGTGLTSRVVNATSLTTSPTFNVATAGTLLTLPVGFTGAVSAYGAAGYITCTQLLGQ